MFKKILKKLRGTAEKRKNNVILRKPLYLNRHQGRDFLILATGPSLKENKDRVQKFIDKYRPIVMAGNFINNMFVPDYHA